MVQLLRYKDYTRCEAHDILAPETPFTPNTGTWGLQGIVRVPPRDGDFALFMTFGQEQAEHQYREWVTEDGVLHWESQPGQGLEDKWVQQFIRHDERRNHIYLFLRTDKASSTPTWASSSTSRTILRGRDRSAFAGRSWIGTSPARRCSAWDSSYGRRSWHTTSHIDPHQARLAAPASPLNVATHPSATAAAEPPSRHR